MVFYSLAATGREVLLANIMANVNRRLDKCSLTSAVHTAKSDSINHELIRRDSICLIDVP